MGKPSRSDVEVRGARTTAGPLDRTAARHVASPRGEIEGLIHLSELSDKPVQHPREVVKEGDTLELRIIRIDPARKRMGLSLRRVDDPNFTTEEPAVAVAPTTPEAESDTAAQ